MRTARVPGKILLTGEYAVLDGSPAIVAAVDRFVECRRTHARSFEVRGMGLCWREGGPEVAGLNFAREALAVTRRYLLGRGVELAAHAFELTDDLRAPDGQKLGLGGSACVTVAVVEAALAIAEANGGQARIKALSKAQERDRIFKLAALAHSRAQGKIGSGVDVAAASFGGLILTRRFEQAPFHAAFDASPEAFARFVDGSPAHPIEQLPIPGELLLLFSGKSASTPALVTCVRQAARRHPEAWRAFLAASEAATESLARALRARDMAAARRQIKAAWAALDAFEPLTDVDITAPNHRELMALAEAAGCAAKPSGAGGGDSAFAMGATERLEALRTTLLRDGQFAFVVAVCPPV